jgi:GT2 family glycosyltransferase
MEPLTIDRTHILVLNYNGRHLLGECLPSIVQAAARAPVPCRVTVVDNASTDDSAEWLAANWPTIGLIRHENLGLASLNSVLAMLDEPVVLLLNNDVKLAVDAVGPLIDAFEDHGDALFSAPLCWTFDGEIYEGMRTRVRSRFGLIQGMSRVPGFEQFMRQRDLTAAAGPVLAVHRERFLAMGGYDPIYFPGRIEDLDLGFRGWMAGYCGYYVPESVAYHQGFGTFGPALGARVCDHLASRNSLIFAWKNNAGLRLFAHLAWLPARLAAAVARGRLGFVSAFVEALGHLPRIWTARRALAVGRGPYVERQEAFYRQFAWTPESG